MTEQRPWVQGQEPVPPPSTAEQKAESTSLGDLLGEVTSDISTLMRQEVALAKAELRESASRAGKGAGMLVGAAEAGRFVLLFLSLALTGALASLIGWGWSALIVAVIWAIIAAILAVVGKKEISSIRGLPRTTETVQEIPAALKPGKDTP
ncbi:phage holin family protein [Paenarthrobacter sp. Z7-10]|uniref:phage holin family protein n=1 Tax=Paenarthrobacter sp. Z7-10 TaxID=2787635 RepID=UPI0022A8D439|nr:phage holin family protein [Paenarthrobacter sp. Z7-10]MCZ2404359.1 phage holin family protein [Paenarthrobacter sp. Z7-10]